MTAKPLVQLKVNPQYETLLPKLGKEEYEALKFSIKTEGQHYPIIVNSEGTILDGYHRFQICQELQLAVKYDVKEFTSVLHEKKFVIESNLLRRQLTTFQRIELSYPLLEIERELAKQRQREASGFVSSLSSNELEVGQARDIVAKTICVSSTNYQRGLIIIEKGSEELKAECRTGQKSIFSAYQQIQREVPKEYAPIPEGQYNIIYADPPWQYDFSLSDMGDPETFYPTLPTDELCKLSVPSSENALLFLWATNPKLEDALKVMRAWGFVYKTNMVWVKDRWATGYYFRGQHELLLIGKKGNPILPQESERVSSVLIAPKGEHSEKPKEVYALIERLYPDRKYLELFARAKREGWTCWGNGI